MALTTKPKRPVEDEGPELHPTDFALGGPVDDLHPFTIDVAPTVVADKGYARVMWKNVVPVFKCSSCGHCENIEDDIIMHVLTHAPEGERDKLLERLIANKEK